MVEPEAKLHVSLKEGLPWLKRLQGALDDDDSSDSSSYPTNIMSVKVVKKKKKPEKEGDDRRRVTKRQRQQEDNDSDYESSEGSEVAKEMQRRVLNKNDTSGTSVRRKRPYRAPKKEQSKELKKRKISVASGATALKEQRKRNLCMRREIARKNDRIALKLTQDESSRAIRFVQNDQTIFVDKEVDIEVDNERWKRLSLGLRCRRDSTEKHYAKGKVLKAAASSTMKTENEHVDLPIVAIGNALHALKQDEEDEVGPRFVAEAIAAELTKHDGNEEELMTTPEPIEHENHDEVSLIVIKNENNELNKLERNGEPESILTKPKKAGINVIAKAETSEDAKEVVTSEKCEEAGAAHKILGAALAPTVTSSDFGKHGSQDKMKEEVLVDVKAAPRLVKKEGNDERQAESRVVTQNANGSVKSEDGAEKNSNEKKRKDLVLEMMPIPRKRMKTGVSTALSNAESFVIPKRSCGNSDKGAHTAVAQASRARTSKSRARMHEIDKNSLGTPGSVTMLSLPIPGSSPKLSKVVNPVRPVSKRLKNPVPVKKNASICRQDQVLMRLSRKRNSIFMAATELTAQAPDFRSNTGRMMGYEVYDVDGKALPDLIPRLSCATKREMASNRESHAASFFGVSLSLPKAIEKTSPIVYECGNDLGIRKISCYEELRFHRFEEREYYQRRMYGTAFVPQKLRGWITLMIRNARFERKSTGIRFNQDRDREEFAASLSKRYSHNKSVPRCDIPRENWHKLMRNQPASVFLHYYNREDAEQASHIFRDDLGHPLELKLNLKAGVVIRASSFPAVGPSSQRVPRRSHSSERSVPESSPVSSQNGSPRNTSTWRRERLPVPRSDNQYSRYGPPSLLPWSRGQRQYNTFDGGSKRSRAMVKSRSRSRSRSKSFHDRRNGPNAHEGRADQGKVKRDRTSPLAPDTRERTDSGNKNAVYSDADTPARKQARSSPRSPRRSPIFGQDTSKCELKIDDERKRREEGEILSKSEINPVRTTSERDRRSGMHRARSPSRRWQQEPINTEVSQRWDHISNYSCARSRSPAARHRFDQQWSNRNMNKQRSRSRSRSRPETLPMQSGRGGNYSDQYNLQRGFRGFERAGAYDNGIREHGMYMDRGRLDYDGRRGGSDLRPRQ